MAKLVDVAGGDQGCKCSYGKDGDENEQRTGSPHIQPGPGGGELMGQAPEPNAGVFTNQS